MLTSEQVARAAAEAVGAVRGIEPLAGDASTRRFFRLSLAGGGTLVGMVFEEPIDPSSHPQILVGRYFESLNFPVPKLRASLPEAGLLLYEDLGDLLLQELVLGDRAAPAGEIERLYGEAVALIGALQDQGTRNLPPGHPSATTALDRDRFLYELRFFQEHYLTGLRALRFGSREQVLLEGFFDALAEAASSPPRVLCHRDYHSRNLVVLDGRIRLVDFQDARLGPVAYDLVSLLCDSYVVLPAELRERLFQSFLALSAGLVSDPARFRVEFDTVALQRNLKAIGTFAYQSVVRGKDDYLRYIDPTWRHALGALGRLTRFADLVPILEMAAGL